MKHTPGPWAVNPLWPCNVNTEDRELEIACTGESITIGGGHPPTEQREANARLIAAAPELLELIQKVSDFGGSPDSLSIGHIAALRELGRNAGSLLTCIESEA